LTYEAVMDAIGSLHEQHGIVTAPALAERLGVDLRIADGCLIAVCQDNPEWEWERALAKAKRGPSA